MTENMLPGFGPPEDGPQSDEDWFAKWIEISDLFNPHAPVQESDLFAGRGPQLSKMVEAVFEAGQHIVVYGDRGVGKTSLINVVLKRILANKPSIKIFQIQCFAEDDFIRIWERAFKRYKWPDGSHALDDIDDSVGPDELFDIISRFNANENPIFAFDEFDRITDEYTKIKMAETIKLLSDRSSYTTIIVAGVGRTIRDLISEHESIRRAVRQIEMPRMSRQEISEIVSVRIKRAGMSIEQAVISTIVWLSHGMPGYCQLLGKYSAKDTIDNKGLNIEIRNLLASLDTCLEETFESTRHTYATAIQSAKPNSQFQHTLVACAIAGHDEFGRFTAAALREPLSAILERERDIPDYNRHLRAFCSDERGPILEREGSPKNYRYRFIDPMMMSYVLTKGIKDGLLSTNQE